MNFRWSHICAKDWSLSTQWHSLHMCSIQPCTSQIYHKCVSIEPPRHPMCNQMLLEIIPGINQNSGIPILYLLAFCDLQITWFQSQLLPVLHCKHQLWRLLMDLEMCQEGIQTTKVYYSKQIKEEKKWQSYIS
jgi:hypothetical protein